MMQKPLHIGLVYGCFPPLDSYSGIVRYIVALAKGYRSLRHQVTVITRDDANPRTEVLDSITIHRVAAGIPSFVPKISKNLLDSLKASAAYAKKIQQLHQTKPLDLVEFSNFGAEGLIHAFNKVVPHVTRVSTMGWQSQQINAKILAQKSILLGDSWRNWCEGVAIRRSDLVLTPTQAHAMVVQQRYGLRQKPIAIPHGNQLPEVTHKLLDEREYVEFLFVGKMDPRKGFEVLLKAFDKTHKQLGQQVRLKVVGEDTNLAPDRQSFKEYALRQVSESARSCINFLGRVADADLPAIYASCDVLVAPSRYESFGLIALEAMQFQKPVIGCFAGGMPEIILHNETGLLVQPEDETALADAMLKLASARALRIELGQNGWLRWQAEFTEQRMCERSLEAYAMLLQQRSNLASKH